MQIKMSNLNYNFDNNGNTSSINISFSGNEGSNFISQARVDNCQARVDNFYPVTR